MSKVLARFWVQSVTKTAATGGAIARNVKLAPVIRPHGVTGAEGNVDWSKYTPSGTIELNITAEGAGQQFEDHLGKDVAITFDFDVE